jgi:hypothetical protein
MSFLAQCIFFFFFGIFSQHLIRLAIAQKKEFDKCMGRIKTNFKDPKHNQNWFHSANNRVQI